MRYVGSQDAAGGDDGEVLGLFPGAAGTYRELGRVRSEKLAALGSGCGRAVLRSQNLYIYYTFNTNISYLRMTCTAGVTLNSRARERF
jgi:hypothetical protein